MKIVEYNIDISNNPKAQQLLEKIKRDKEIQMNSPMITREEFNKLVEKHKK